MVWVEVFEQQFTSNNNNTSNVWGLRQDDFLEISDIEFTKSYKISASNLFVYVRSFAFNVDNSNEVA